MPAGATSTLSFDALARSLEILSSEPRLRLLYALRAPRPLHGLRVEATLRGEASGRARSISRQAVTKHLNQLAKFQLVERIPGGKGSHRDTYVLNHQRLFAVVDELRNLAKLRPILSVYNAKETIVRPGPGPPRLPRGPRLLVAYGRDDGVAFSLEGRVGSRWRIGRGRPCEILLDYDPFLSAEHAIIERTSEGHVLRDAASRNGTWLNWEALAPGGTRSLTAGDLIAAGRSLLVFQGGRP